MSIDGLRRLRPLRTSDLILVAGGKGTRVPVDLVVGKLAGGMTVEQVAEEYDLAREDVLAALRYAAEAVAGEQVRQVR